MTERCEAGMVTSRSGQIAAWIVRGASGEAGTTAPVPPWPGLRFSVGVTDDRRCGTDARVTFALTGDALAEVADRLDAAPGTGVVPDAADRDDDETLQRLAALLLPELGFPGRAPSPFVDHLLQAFAIHAGLAYAGLVPGSRSRRGGLAPWQLRRAQDLMRAHLDDSIRLEDIASACRLSVSHFSRAFRQSTGVAPYAWLQQERIAAAKVLLRARSTSLSDVAIACGFSDQSHFTRVFHRIVGASPGTWRRRAAVPS